MIMQAKIMALWYGASLLYEIKKEMGATAVSFSSNKVYISMKDPQRIIEVDMTNGASKFVAYSNQVIDCLVAAIKEVVVVYIADDHAKHLNITQQGGLVHTMLALGDELFVGAQPLNATDLTPLNGHSRGVLTLCQFTDKQLLSGSADKTMRMCKPHTGELLSSTREDNHGFVALCRIHNRANMPILLISSRDNSVRMYNFPSLTEIGRLFSLAVVKSIFQMADYFLTRDSSGHVVYWQLADSEGRDDENMRAHVPNTSVGFQLLKHGKCHDTDVKGIAYLKKNRNSKHYTGCRDGLVEWDPCTGQREPELENGDIGSMFFLSEYHSFNRCKPARPVWHANYGKVSLPVDFFAYARFRTRDLLKRNQAAYHLDQIPLVTLVRCCM